MKRFILAIVGLIGLSGTSKAEHFLISPVPGLGENVTISYNNHLLNGFAGEQLIFRDGVELSTFCVDLDNVNSNSTYEVRVESIAALGKGQTGLKVGWLYNQIERTTKAEFAGLQLAIWETEYGNKFSVVNASTSALAYQASYLSNLSLNFKPGKEAQADYFVDVNNCNQNLVGNFMVPPQAVPEPASLGLFAIGGFVFLSKFNRRKV